MYCNLREEKEGWDTVISVYGNRALSSHGS
jgi:hypothetical protein